MKIQTSTKFGLLLLFSLIIAITIIHIKIDETQLPEEKILEILEQTRIPKLQLTDFTFIDAIQHIEKLSAEYALDKKGIKINCSSNISDLCKDKINIHLSNCSLISALNYLCELNDCSYKIKNGAFYIFPKAEKINKATATLKKNGIFISDESCKQVFSPYLRNEKFPPFITSDSLIKVYHVLYEESILQLENAMALKLPEILKLLLNGLDIMAEDVKGNPILVDAAKKRANIVVGVALRLMDNSFKFDDKELNIILTNEIKKIKEAKVVDKPKWLGNFNPGIIELDYSRYKPRGFYTKSEKLKSYFRAISWLHSIPFYIKNDEEFMAILLLGRSVQIIKCSDLTNNQDLKGFLNAYKSFIGNKDDWDLLTAAHEAQTSFNCDELKAKRNSLIKNSQKYGELPKINDQIKVVHEKSNQVDSLNFRVMSAYRTPSAILFQQTGGRTNRPLPKGLDVCVALGSKFAEDNIEYSEKEKLLKIIENNKKYFKGNSLYFSYLNALKALLDEPETNAPAFMKNDAWKAKSCNTVLAGWAQLRHTWILQAKQNVYYVFCGKSYPPVGFVEPNPEFFCRVADLAAKTRIELDYTGIFATNINFKLEKLWFKLESLSRRLEAIAHKQLRGIDFNRSENTLFGTYGENIAEIMFYEGDSYDTPQDDAPRIANVFSAYINGVTSYLHVGISRPRKIYVLYPWKGKSVLCVGAVLPYYEFVNNSRLTDSEWKKMLDSDNRPPILKWQEPIIKGGRLTKPDLKDLRE